MKTNGSSNKERTSKKYSQPHCLDCGGTRINFTYTEGDFGHEIVEGNALEMVCYYLADVLRGETESDSDPEHLQAMATTIARIAAMRRVRPPVDNSVSERER